METAIIFDCEFLVIPGASQNFWCGPFDPDPVIAQIGEPNFATSTRALTGLREAKGPRS